MAVVKLALIIDDDEINNYICIKQLTDSGFADEVKYCIRGKDALDLLRDAIDNDPDALPDMILLDINMPLMNAWEFLDEYKRLVPSFKKDIKLFILSSSVYRKDVEKSTSYAEVLDYIYKPLTKEKLIELQEKYYK